MTIKSKTKRKLSEIDFSREDAHIALVSKEQGGPANGADYALILKAVNPEEVPQVEDTPVEVQIEQEIEKDVTGVSGATKSPKGRVSKKKEIPMTQEVEMVEKSQLAAVEKALAEQQTLLQKALETVAKFEAEKKEAITKARFDSVKQAVASEEIATILFKAVGLVEDEAVFVEVVKALGDMKALVEKSAMFQEVGASAEESAPAIEESGVTKLLKAQFGVK